MSALSFHRETCRLCESRNLEKVLPMPATPIAEGYVARDQRDVVQPVFPLDLYFCVECGHCQLLDVVDPAALFQNYLYVTSSSMGLVEYFRKQTEDVIRRVGPPAGSLAVDIGSNDGTVLRFFKDHGLRVLGIDPAREIAAKATDSGVETGADFFTSTLAMRLRNERGPAAVVTANNVYAHSDHLGDITDGIRILLAPDGVFVFEVSYLGDVLERTMLDTIYHEHLAYHSLKPLNRFLDRHGLQLFDVEKTTSKGGTLRGFAQVKGGPRPVTPRVSEWATREESLGLDRPASVRRFADRIAAARGRLQDLLGEARAKGKRIAGYGASAGVTTMTYTLGVGPFLEYLVDDNARKHGLFSPGHHLPIFPSDELYTRKPDMVVILAWTYAEPIMKRHRAFVEKGGRFIVPLPEVTVT